MKLSSLLIGFIQIKVGYTLRNVGNNELEYFFASNNTSVFQDPISVFSNKGLDQAFNSLKSSDIEKNCLRKRPGSSYVFFCPINAIFYIYPMNSFIRGSNQPIQTYFKKNSYMMSFLSPEIEPDCFFYCLHAFF